MYIALFLVALLCLFSEKKRQRRLYGYAVVSTILVFCPASRWLLEKYFQGFYSPDKWEWMLPVWAGIAYAATLLLDRLEDEKRRRVMPIVCIVIVLCGWFMLDTGEQAFAALQPGEEAIQVYEMMLAHGEESKSAEKDSKNDESVGILFVAPRELMVSARAFDARIMPVYGRDLWETDLDYVCYDNYEEWAYLLAEQMDKPLAPREQEVLDSLTKSGAGFVVFNKDNLEYDEAMQYPQMLWSTEVEYRRLNETRHYVIYTRK